ncbi:RTA1 domain-containing protein [Aspergillus aculeatinus CBS 121060]|uniref:RTA1 like protein n=1 Tax=Aspergillus aculeatinus CBS 121060 TaxID=1448322 RepID=A0ACD1H7F7_9EURO|nr:RTA1 like protein [Aspergillus aculeatinus CBS 121060]RAH69334.1 RTA1 like protein [Aspergillus aculeatinus CBS 121060]
MANPNTDQNASGFVLYRYTPSIAAAVVFTVVFCALAIFFIYRIVRHRTLFFIPFLVGLIFEAAGYIARIFSHSDTQALGPYITQTMLILVAPPLFAASIYMTLGRLITQLRAESASLIRVRWLTKIFVVGDVISFLLQCGGGGYMSAGSDSAMLAGEHIVVAGLAIQLLFFGFFVLVASLFHWRCVTSMTPYSTTTLKSQSGRLSWRGLMWALYAACTLILVRSVFRVVEFVQGNDGWIMHREYLLYIFDALLMAGTAMVLGFVFPGSFLEGQKRGAERADSV